MLKILLPVDESLYSLYAVRFVAARTKLLGSKPRVMLLNAQMPWSEALLKNGAREAFDEFVTRASEKVFAPLRKILRTKGIDAEEKVVVGRPADAVAAAVKSIRPDLIVMGAQGLTNVKKLFLGSVSTSVISKTRVPVLLVRGRQVGPASGIKVGIALDGSGAGDAAATCVVKHLALLGPDPKIFLLHVFEGMDGIKAYETAGYMTLNDEDKKQLRALEEEEYEEAFAPARRILKEAGITAQEVKLEGMAGDAIAKYGAKEGLDLIVMGSHGYSNFKSAVMGSVATRVAAEGKIPLLVVRG